MQPAALHHRVQHTWTLLLDLMDSAVTVAFGILNLQFIDWHGVAPLFVVYKRTDIGFREGYSSTYFVNV